MVGKRVDNIEEIRAYVKVCTELVHSVIQIFTEFGKVSSKLEKEIFD